MGKAKNLLKKFWNNSYSS